MAAANVPKPAYTLNPIINEYKVWLPIHITLIAKKRSLKTYYCQY